MKRTRTNHGWILKEDGGAGFKATIYVEWVDGQGKRCHKQMERYGEMGAAEAVEFWEKKLGQPIKLQPMLAGSYRVYTEN